MAVRRLFSASLWFVFFWYAVNRGFELLLFLFLVPGVLDGSPWESGSESRDEAASDAATASPDMTEDEAVIYERSRPS